MGLIPPNELTPRTSLDKYSTVRGKLRTVKAFEPGVALGFGLIAQSNREQILINVQTPNPAGHDQIDLKTEWQKLNLLQQYQGEVELRLGVLGTQVVSAEPVESAKNTRKIIVNFKHGSVVKGLGKDGLGLLQSDFYVGKSSFKQSQV